jgi:hypothetical protein
MRSAGLRRLSTAASHPSIVCNGQTYRLPRPGKPVVGICMDGSSHDYFEAAAQVRFISFFIPCY